MKLEEAIKWAAKQNDQYRTTEERQFAQRKIREAEKVVYRSRANGETERLETKPVEGSEEPASRWVFSNGSAIIQAGDYFRFTPEQGYSVSMKTTTLPDRIVEPIKMKEDFDSLWEQFIPVREKALESQVRILQQRLEELIKQKEQVTMVTLEPQQDRFTVERKFKFKEDSG